MAKSSKRYWFDRNDAEKAAMAAVHAIVGREKFVAQRQAAIFKEALKQLDAELDALRADVGDAEITRATMQKPLTPKQLENWSKRQEDRLDELIDEFGEDEGRRIYGAENAKTAKRDRARRIVRQQEALKQSIEVISSMAAARSEQVTKEALKAEASKGADAFKKQFKADAKVNFNTVSQGELNQVINTHWAGGNYSERIWADRDEMVKDLERAVNLGVTNGWSIPRIAKEVEHHVAVNEHSAERIARTEMNRVSNAAEMAHYEANDIHYYRFVATEDARTCEICGELHDKVFAVADAVVGENFPPVHPNCRCRTVGSFVDDKGKDDDKWLDDLINETEELLDGKEGRDMENDSKLETDGMKEFRTVENVQPVDVASKSLAEDGLVYGHQFDSAVEADKLMSDDENIKEAIFALDHVQPVPGTDAFRRVAPRLQTMRKLRAIYDSAPHLESKKRLKIEFGDSNEDKFDEVCKAKYPGLDFKDAAGAFFPSSANAEEHSVIFRRDATQETVCHEIGHVVHEFNDSDAYGDGDSRDKKIIGKAVNKTKTWLRNRFGSFGVDRNRNGGVSDFERALLRSLDSEYTPEQHRHFAELHAGSVTLFHKVNELVMESNAFGIHYGNDIKAIDDPNYKELVANVVGIYLSRDVRACRFFEQVYGVSFGPKDGYNLPKIARGYLRNMGYTFDWLDGAKP